MGKTRDFEAEYKAFLQKYPYKIIEVNGIKIRYQSATDPCFLSWQERKTRPLFCFSMDWKCRKCGCLTHCISVKTTVS